MTDELNGAKTELGRYKNEKAVLQAGIKGKYVNAAISEAARLAGEQSCAGSEMTFEKAV